ncbi:MAG: M23 family metallopeptidase [Candidatus Solibacter sp.]
MRTATSFIIGFALGIVCLAAVLWSTGRLVLTPVQAARIEPVSLPLPAAPEVSAAPAPPSAESTPTPPLPGTTYPPDTPPAVTRPDMTAPTTYTPKLAMPVAGIDPGTLHTNFSEARGGHAHEALDIMTPRGTPVLAVAEGNVVKLFNSKPGGLTVYQFDNTQKWCYYYAHLDRYAAGLKEGMLLRKGEVLGYAGSTGDASPNAPHLHFAVFELGPEKSWWKGTAIDPLPLFK